MWWPMPIDVGIYLYYDACIFGDFFPGLRESHSVFRFSQEQRIHNYNVIHICVCDKCVYACKLYSVHVTQPSAYDSCSFLIRLLQMNWNRQNIQRKKSTDILHSTLKLTIVCCIANNIIISMRNSKWAARCSSSRPMRKTICKHTMAIALRTRTWY